MKYDDFVIAVSSDNQGRYQARVLESPLGRRGALTALPLSADGPEEILKTLRGQLREAPTVMDTIPGRKAKEVTGARGGSRARASEPATLEDSLGRPLYEALLPDELAGHLRECLAGLGSLTDSGEERGLRIRLLFGNPEDGGDGITAPAERDDLLRFGAMPWEYLWDPRNQDFLALSRLTPVVRTLDVPRPLRPLMAKDGLRVLVVASTPADMTDLDASGEIAGIRRALEKLEAVDVEVLTDPSFDLFQRTIRRGEHHVFHFIGHGEFDKELQAGVLYFVDADGASEPVPAQLLANHLKDCRQLRLAVLNACRTAQMPRRLGENPWSSVAAALTLAGIPAVVAMQYPIGDRSAVEFASELYECLAMGDVLETAVAEGRLAIHRRPSRAWGTPVLYLRGKEGRIVNVARPAEVDRTGTPAPLHLGIQSYVGWGRQMRQEGARVLDLHRYFDPACEGRFILDPALWNDAIVPKLWRFLTPPARQQDPLLIDLAAHPSIAFAAGYFLEAKGGIRVTLRQRSPRGVDPWRCDEGPTLEEPLWQPVEEIPADSGSLDLAVVISLTRPALADVRAYLEHGAVRVRRILALTVAPDVGQKAVAGGAHAWQLAQDLANRIDRRSAEEKQGALHLFTAAPNGFLFFLGQLARSFRHIRLYEHDFHGDRHGTYEPSVALGPGAGRDRRPRG